MQEENGRQTHWYYTFVAPISVMAFWFAIVLAALGSLMTFVPGGETHWFGFTAIFFAAGLFANGYKYRTAAAILLILCIFATYNGYVRGIEHQEFLKTLPELLDTLPK